MFIYIYIYNAIKKLNETIQKKKKKKKKKKNQINTLKRCNTCKALKEEPYALSHSAKLVKD